MHTKQNGNRRDTAASLARSRRRFIERAGALARVFALPATAGHVHALLLLSPQPRSVDEISELLGASRASVGSNMRRLERLGAVARVSVPGDRRDYYRVADDPCAGVFEATLRQLRCGRDLMRDETGFLDQEDEVVRRRVAALAEIQESLVEMIERRIEASRSRHTRDEGAAGAAERP